MIQYVYTIIITTVQAYNLLFSILLMKHRLKPTVKVTDNCREKTLESKKFFIIVQVFGKYSSNKHNISVALDPDGMLK